MRLWQIVILNLFGLGLIDSLAAQQPNSFSERRAAAQMFHQQSQQRSGIIVPMYVYPANIHRNAEYNRLIEIKRRYEIVPIWVIVNPASGPGKEVDANYTKAIDRLKGAGCVVLGYVSTRYGERPKSDVERDVDRWETMYPATQGIFFDEMLYKDTPDAVQQQLHFNEYAHDQGFWPTVANPGTDTPGRFFAKNAADVFVVHEGSDWPTETRLHGDYFGGYSDFPPWTRSVLVHSMKELDTDRVSMMRKYARWFYVTERPFRPDDPQAQNPWDRLSQHMEALAKELATK